MNPKLKRLTKPEKLYSRQDVFSKPCPVPEESGVYAWFFTDELSMVPYSECIKYNDFTLLYIGIAPSKPRNSDGKISKRTLRSRIKEHYSSNSYGSTLRLSLGCLLSKKLGIQLRRLGKSGKRMTFTKEGEKKLSVWMENNALVTWIENASPWELEEIALKELSVPLNLRGNEHHPFHSTLTEKRKITKILARELPVAS